MGNLLSCCLSIEAALCVTTPMHTALLLNAGLCLPQGFAPDRLASFEPHILYYKRSRPHLFYSLLETVTKMSDPLSVAGLGLGAASLAIQVWNGAKQGMFR